MTEPLDIVFILGCTGCGKGAVARELARRAGGEIISVDSMKVYRRMDIGTAKPSRQARREVPHHLIDVAEPSEAFSTARFVELAETAAADIVARGRVVLAVGGTGLYIKALSEGLFEGPSADPEVRARLHEKAEREGLPALHAELASVDAQAADRIHPNDLRRIVRALEVHQLTGTPISTLQTQWDRSATRHRCTFLGLRRSIEDQNRRTNARVKRLIELGWVDEVRSLLAESPPPGRTARQALGYSQLMDFVQDKITLEDATETIKIATRQFAKSQRTWFKRFHTTCWFDVGPDESVADVADRMCEQCKPLCPR